MNLSNKKGSKIIVVENQLVIEINKGKMCIIGWLHAKRVITKEVLWSTMMKLYKTTSPYSVLEIHLNTFIFNFDNDDDMQWVMSCKP